MKLVIMIFFLVLFGSGCASTIARSDIGNPTGAPTGVYPGLRLDVDLVRASYFGGPSSGMDSFMSDVGKVLSPFFVIDAPLSFGVDTVLAPSDCYRYLKDAKKDEDR